MADVGDVWTKPASARRWAPALFALTAFTGAALLFAVQPLVGKLVLPLYGGPPAVWTACLLFFQALLLAGYAYAHAATAWLGARRQAALHLVLLLAPLAALPVAVRAAPAAGADPLLSLLLTLAAAVGLPFFVVSATAPLVQKWFAGTGGPAARDPYFLYAASNLGSLLALAAYSTLIEPLLPLSAQGVAWAAGYGVLAALIAACAVVLWRSPAPADKAAVTAPAPAVTAGRRLRWVLLAFAPSSLLMGATAYLAADVASHPLLWLPPLALYLLSFILVFSRPPRALAGRLPAVRRGLAPALPLLVLLLLFLMLSGTQPPGGWAVALHLAVLFVVCLVCHGELAADRPDAARLTEFYLWISVGGVLGGVFNAVLAPMLFAAVAEYPLALVLACLLLPPLGAGRDRPRGARLELTLAAACLLAGLVLAGLRLADGGLDFTHLVNGGWAWPAVVLAAAGIAGAAYVLRRREGRLDRALDFALPFALAVLVVGLVWGVAARAVAEPLTQLAAALRLPPAPALRVVAVGLPAVLCFTFVERPARFGLGAAALTLGVGFCGLFDPSVLYQTRNFYGVLQVTRGIEGIREFYYLYNGTTLHGAEAAEGGGRGGEPVGYYHRGGPIGRVFAEYNAADPPPDVAVVGLGVGGLAAYGRPGQRFVFYEINPAVRAVALQGGYFTYWADAEARGVRLDLVMGDARLALAGRPEDETYGLLVVDAFSSDAIPVHLIDREALDVYLRRLAPRGVIAFHISNLHVDLQPVLANLARDRGLAGLVRHDRGGAPGTAATSWAVLARDKKDLERLRKEGAWEELTPDPAAGVWTDDYSNLWGVLRP
jgi:hypothetical protein